MPAILIYSKGSIIEAHKGIIFYVFCNRNNVRILGSCSLVHYLAADMQHFIVVDYVPEMTFPQHESLPAACQCSTNFRLLWLLILKRFSELCSCHNKPVWNCSFKIQYQKNKDIRILLYQGNPALLDSKSATKATEILPQ